MGRVITILSGAAAKLVGLSITGGSVVGPNVRYIWRNPTSDDFADKDYSSQGGGLLVEKGGTADLEDCHIFDNTAIDVRSTFDPAFRALRLGADFVPCRTVAGLGERPF